MKHKRSARKHINGSVSEGVLSQYAHVRMRALKAMACNARSTQTSSHAWPCSSEALTSSACRVCGSASPFVHAFVLCHMESTSPRNWSYKQEEDSHAIRKHRHRNRIDTRARTYACTQNVHKHLRSLKTHSTHAHLSVVQHSIAANEFKQSTQFLDGSNFI